MNQIIWSKTILSAYRYLERVAQAIDKLVIKEAMGSIAYTGLSSIKTAQDISDRILDYTEKKVALINTKVYVEKALLSLGREQARLLVKKYIQGKKTNEVISEMKLPRRTFYRKLEAAEKAFAHALILLGADEEKLDMMLSDQKWLMRIYSEFEKVYFGEREVFSCDIFEKQNTFLQNLCRASKVSLFG